MIISLLKIYLHLKMYIKFALKNLIKKYYFSFIRHSRTKHKNIEILKNKKIINCLGIS